MTGILVAALFVVVPPARVAAHCPGSEPPDTRDYAAGHRTISNYANGIKADIQYTSKTVCSIGPGDGFSAESITVGGTGGLDGWVQVGWERTEGGVNRMYCEFQPTPATLDGFIYYFSVTAATHNYMVSYDSLDSLWDCYLDGAWKKSHGGLGFNAGRYLTSMGEVNSTHSQIGRNAPNKLLFSTMKYRLISSLWDTWSPNTFVRDSPYGASSAVGQFLDWTNAH